MSVFIRVEKIAKQIDSLKEILNALESEEQKEAIKTSINFLNAAISNAVNEKWVVTYALPKTPQQAELRKLELLGTLRELWDFNKLNPLATEEEKVAAKRALLCVMREHDWLKTYIKRMNVQIAAAKQKAKAEKVIETEKSVTESITKKPAEKLKPKRSFSAPALSKANQ